MRGIAIVDFSEQDDLNLVNSELFSAEHMVKVAGVPYVVTRDLDEALQYSILLFSSKLTNATLSDSEDDLVDSYVSDGGVIVVPILEDEDVFSMFGISSSTPIKTRFSMEWNQNTESNELEWIDEPEEWTISLGRPTLNQTIKTYGYITTTAQALASYEDLSAAVTHNSYGQGQAISFGLSWKDVILRNQINRDFQAQRVTSNGFEPTSDVFSLFIRGVYQAYNQFAVWMHTSPSNSKSTLILTHDVDSQSGIDSLNMFVDYEKEHNIEATYNITTRYFNDALMGAFYTDSEETMDYIAKNGQAFGSHSVGHFFDFADESIFPLGTIGNTMENYLPYNNGAITSGGTVYGECELSKNILEEDLKRPITFFRTGHLAYPKNLVDVLDDLGYLYNSSSSASDVLTSFPYQNVMGRSFNGAVSNVYDIPVSISDVFHEDDIAIDNYDNLVELWNEVTIKNMNNGAPTILLIHPNRGYKVDALSDYFDALPSGVTTMEITKYGDFWKARESYQFKSLFNEDNSVLTLQLLDNINEDLSFICDNGQLLDEIIILDKDGYRLQLYMENWNDQDLIIYFNDIVSSVIEDEEIELPAINIFPNPSSGEIHFRYPKAIDNQISVELYDMSGNHLRHLLDLNSSDSGHQYKINLRERNIEAGNYLVLFVSEQNGVITKKVTVI